MPKVVDRDARRREIIESYLAILAKEGAEAATTRRVSRELGISNGSLWHYFDSFDELVSQAYALVFERTNERIGEAARGRRGIGALLVMMEQILPLTELTTEEAYVVITYWNRVAAHRGGGVDRAFREGQWVDGLLVHMSAAIEEGELREEAPQRELIDALIVLARGYQIERVLETPLADNSRQWAAIRLILEPWLTEFGRRQLGAARPH